MQGGEQLPLPSSFEIRAGLRRGHVESGRNRERVKHQLAASWLHQLLTALAQSAKPFEFRKILPAHMRVFCDWRDGCGHILGRAPVLCRASFRKREWFANQGINAQLIGPDATLFSWLRSVAQPHPSGDLSGMPPGQAPEPQYNRVGDRCFSAEQQSNRWLVLAEITADCEFCRLQ